MEINAIGSERGLLASLARGIRSEDKVEKALGVMKKAGEISNFVRTTGTSFDKRGIDFIIMKRGRNIPLQVKSSEVRARKHEELTRELSKSGVFEGITFTAEIPGFGNRKIAMNTKIPVVVVLKKYRCFELIQQISQKIDKYI